MRHLFFFVLLFAAFTVASATPALAAKSFESEPAEVIKTVTEDRGTYLVITTTRQIPATEDTFCYYITVQQVEKKTGEVLSSNSVFSCQDQVL